ncbi:MAG TPA: tetratricopeptide repeat protein [Bacteroidia bacterium]|nr:tetratricopeptide repeat protein [Bacteroidia bacterium]HNT80757.1 tetratricopeptide repeat protein [Bacteroidia bacterium]
MKVHKGNKSQKKSVAETTKQKERIVSSPFPKELYLWLAGILLLTIIAFSSSINNGFTNWDDPKYLTENPLIRSLSSDNIHKIFTEAYFGNYQPLHILSYAIEYSFYELDPTGYHTTSVVMHLLCTALVMWFIWLISGSSLITIIATLLFGVHPMHVESVAWAAERKDLLYTIFFLFAAIFYVKYIKSNYKNSFLLLSMLFFIISGFAKAMAVSFVPVMIIIDYYFKRNLLEKKVIFEKIPFLIFAIIIGAISVTVVGQADTIALDNHFSRIQQSAFAFFNINMYVAKLIVPVKLSSYYAYPIIGADNAIPSYYYLGFPLVFLILGLLIYSTRFNRNIMFAAGFFVATIVLVLQFVPVGPTIFSERYSYIPSISFFYLIGFGINKLVANKQALRLPVFIVLGAYGLWLSYATFERCKIWKDSLTLWNNVLEQFPYVAVAYNNIGNIYGKEQGNLEKAMENFNLSIKYDPEYENAYSNRGIVYAMQGKFDLAEKDFNKALQVKDDYVEALHNRAILYSQTKRYELALIDFNKAIAKEPYEAQQYFNRAVVYTDLNRYNEAIIDFQHAIRLHPKMADAHYRLALAYYNMGNKNAAMQSMNNASALGAKMDPAHIQMIQGGGAQ